MNEMMSNWTIVEKNVRMFTLEGPMLWNRLLWIGISLVTLAFIYLRFRFAHRTRHRPVEPGHAHGSREQSPTPDTHVAHATAIAVPHVRQSFGFATHLRQMLAIAWSSFSDDRDEPARALPAGRLPDVPGAGADGGLAAVGRSAAAAHLVPPDEIPHGAPHAVHSTSG